MALYGPDTLSANEVTSVADALTALGFPPGTYADPQGYAVQTTERRNRKALADSGHLFVSCGGVALFGFQVHERSIRGDGYHKRNAMIYLIVKDSRYLELTYSW